MALAAGVKRLTRVSGSSRFTTSWSGGTWLVFLSI